VAGTGTATIDFGAFPGASDTSLAITGQTAILSGSLVEAWLRPEASADHSATEHMVETIRVHVGDIVAGTGFTIYAFNTSTLNEPVYDPISPRTGGGQGTLIYGTWSVQWAWS
jgi:hypothetical protein